MVTSTKNDISLCKSKRVEQFPTLDGYIIYNSPKYCSYLQKNENVIIRKSMNSFVYTNITSYPFSIGTTVSAIALALSAPTATVIYVLSAISVAISATNKIQEAVSLCGGMTCNYYATLIGTVWDETYQDAYVIAYNRGPVNGRLNGGYSSATSTNSFVWNLLNGYTPDFISPAYNPNTVASLTMANYIQNLYDNNGMCLLPVY
ncbi:hypothetical protein SDC9_54329 [bioreactor metagenome]|uniref:Uncharacterized protein n=1 Tax=bioreactor metagenome TaxID=1076179 RepID=A0A644WWE8_9ZZZZ